MDILGVHALCIGPDMVESGLGVLKDFRRLAGRAALSGHRGEYIFEFSQLRTRWIDNIEFYKASVFDGDREGIAFFAATSLQDTDRRKGFAQVCIVVAKEAEPYSETIKNLLTGAVRSLVLSPDGKRAYAAAKTKLALRAQALTENPPEVGFQLALQEFAMHFLKENGLHVVGSPGQLRVRGIPVPDGTVGFDETALNTPASLSPVGRQVSKAELLDRVDQLLSGAKEPAFKPALTALLARFDR